MNEDFDRENQDTSPKTDDPFESAGFREYDTPQDTKKTESVPLEGVLVKPKTKAYSVVALVAGIVGLVCCCGGWISMACGIVAIVFAVVSRKHLGYFDGMAIAGLVLGIFGVILGILSIVLTFVMGEDLFRDLFDWDEIFGDYSPDEGSPTRSI